MAIPYHQFSFGDALLAAASMVREDRLRREQMALQERQFQRDLALRQQSLEQQERQSVRADRTARRGQSIQRDLGFAGIATTRRGQSIQRDLGFAGIATTRRGQDIQRELGFANIATTRRGQDIQRELGFANIATTRRGQDLTFESGERDRRQRSAFHKDNMDLAREQMLNAREVARISSGGSGARDLLLRIQALAALDQLGFDVNPSDLGLDFDLPRATGFTPPPPSAPHLGTAGDLNTSFWFWEPSQIVGSDERYWFPHKSEGGKVAREYIDNYLTSLERDLTGRRRLTREEAALYLQRLGEAAREIRGGRTEDGREFRGNPNLMPEDLARFTDRIAAMQALVSSKTRQRQQ